MSEKIGLSPQLKDSLNALGSGLSGDIIINILSADDTLPATSSAWTKVVKFQLEDSIGNVMDWFNGTIDALVGDTSTAGTASVDDATPAVVNGVGSIILSGDASAWLATETATIAFSGTLPTKTLATKTFTRTIV